MHKPVNYQTYKMIHRMSLNDFNRWCSAFYVNAFEDGAKSVPVTQGPDNVIAQMSDVDLLEVIKSVSGIGEKRAQKIMDAIIAKGVIV